MSLLENSNAYSNIKESAIRNTKINHMWTIGFFVIIGFALLTLLICICCIRVPEKKKKRKDGINGDQNSKESDLNSED